MAGLLAEVSAWLRNDSEALVLGGLEHLDLGLVEVGGRVSAAQVQQLHSVSQVLPHLHQAVRNLYRLFESRTSVLTRTTVEVDSVQVNTQFFYLSKSFVKYSNLFSAS